MTPIERVRARAAAAEILGVNWRAEPLEIRAAWRRAARSLHPDQHGGDDLSFASARAAYECLTGDADAEDAAQMEALARKARPAEAPRRAARTVPRPSVVDRMLSIPENLRWECEMYLEADPDPKATDHVPEHVVRHGREITYLLPHGFAEGMNRVALPADGICGRVKAPEILKFAARAGGVEEVLLPDAILKQRFPGARIVRLRFARG